MRGRTPGQLQRPTGVAVHPNGDIIIADYDNKWVSIFSSEGKFKVGCAAVWYLMISSNICLWCWMTTFSRNTRLFPPHFSCPAPVSVYVPWCTVFSELDAISADSWKELCVGCISIYTYKRRYVTPLPVHLLQNKIGSGKLMGPKGVSVDRNGHVIVVDNKSCCVFIFQLNGKLVTKFGNRGNGDRQFAGTLGSLSPCSHCPAFVTCRWNED